MCTIYQNALTKLVGALLQRAPSSTRPYEEDLQRRQRRNDGRLGELRRRNVFCFLGSAAALVALQIVHKKMLLPTSFAAASARPVATTLMIWL